MVGCKFIVIPLYHGNRIEGTEQIQTFHRVRAVADCISEGYILIHAQFCAFCENRLKRLQIGMNITQDRVLHFSSLSKLG